MRVLSTLCVALVLAIGCSSKSAVSPAASLSGNACVEGAVTWQGAPVPGAPVSAVVSGATTGQTTLADSAGHFCLSVPAGSVIRMSAASVQGGGPVSALSVFVSGSAAECGGGCLRRDLPLSTSPGRGGRYYVGAYVEAYSPNPDTSWVFCVIRDDSLGVDISGARVRIGLYPFYGVTTLAWNPVNRRYEAGSPAGMFRASFRPELDRRYYLWVDLDGDGRDDASGSVRIPAAATITTPRTKSVVPPDFDMAWSTFGSSDSTRYEALLVGWTTGFVQTGVPDGTTNSVSFSGAPAGTYGADLQGSRGPSPAAGFGEFDLFGANVVGHFWGVIRAGVGPFTVAPPASPLTRAAPATIDGGGLRHSRDLR